MYLLVFDPIDMLNIKTTTTTTTLLFVCFTFYNSKLKLIDNCKLLFFFRFFFSISLELLFLYSILYKINKNNY